MAAAPEVDPAVLAAAAARIALARDDVHAAAETLIDQLPDTGDRHTQELLDALVDHAADALRLLSEELTGTTRGLRTAAARYAEAERAVILNVDRVARTASVGPTAGASQVAAAEPGAP
jgi:ABC-type transporter Mla subunit MlaD